MMTRVLIGIVAGFLTALVLGKLLLPVLRALKVGQSIREVGPTWHNSKSGTPTMGGLIFIAAALVVMAVALQFGGQGDRTPLYVFLLAGCFGLIGFLDDYFKVKLKRNLGLTAIQKALLQMAVSALYLYVLYREGVLTCDLYIPFVNTTVYIHPIAYIFFAMFVMVGCVNSVNLTDGIDGLATSVTIPVMVFFTLASVCLKKWDLALFPAALVGGLAGYLVYNFHPALVFMGDTGSLFLGGAVCAMAFALDMPLILIPVGLVYIIETMSDIIQVAYFKATHGKRIFKMAPIHHHFEKCGWSEEKIVYVFTGVTAVMCVVAWFGIRGLF